MADVVASPADVTIVTVDDGGTVVAVDDTQIAVVSVDADSFVVTTEGVGPRGPMGPFGVGPQGPPGFALDGEDGTDGMPIPGPRGPQGIAGATGPQGPIGFALDGADGADGMPLPGAPGARGPAGADGPAGRDGPPGFGMDGEDGADGYPIPGPRGTDGARGPAGVQGPPGFAIDGEDGQDGMPIPGAAGAPGTPGAPGSPGSAGATGPQGPIGFALDGIDGEEGWPIPGPQGPQGIQGPAGTGGGSTTGGGGFAFDGEDGPEGMPITLGMKDTLNAYQKAQIIIPQIANISGTYTPDASFCNFQLTATANTAVAAPANLLYAGQVFNICLDMDATGGWTLTFDPIYDFGGTPSWVTAASGRNFIVGYYDGARIRCGGSVALFGAQGPAGPTFEFEGPEGPEGMPIPGPQGKPGTPGVTAAGIMFDGADGQDAMDIGLPAQRQEMLHTFRARKSANQSVTLNGTDQAVTFSSTDWNIGAAFASSKFTAKRAGYYHFDFACEINNPVSATMTTVFASVYKNGSVEFYGDFVSIAGQTDVAVSAHGLVYLNGSGDYVEFRVGGASSPASASASIIGASAVAHGHLAVPVV